MREESLWMSEVNVLFGHGGFILFFRGSFGKDDVYEFAGGKSGKPWMRVAGFLHRLFSVGAGVWENALSYV